MCYYFTRGVIMNENNFELGNYLKTIRNEYGITTRSLGNKIGYSHSYISSVENNAKRNPSQDFIEKYLLGLTDNNTSDANFFIENINKLSNNEYSFSLLKSLEDIKPLLSQQAEKFIDTYTFTYKVKNKNINKDISKNISFEIPINDLIYHLNDEQNFKFFGNIPLYAQERKDISILITNYLYDIYKSRLNFLNDLHNKKEISEEFYEKELKYVENILSLLKYVEI
ncbi:helix-turn-helix transcriptional regulator [Staphylococcus hominis]|nr:helix-turn-helix domain-containing protein [Staphylococcus hominis]UJB23929.1 helix-turn-helix transcriptional regulator [Staphylococcus hominis]